MKIIESIGQIIENESPFLITRRILNDCQMIQVIDQQSFTKKGGIKIKEKDSITNILFNGNRIFYFYLGGKIYEFKLGESKKLIDSSIYAMNTNYYVKKVKEKTGEKSYKVIPFQNEEKSGLNFRLSGWTRFYENDQGLLYKRKVNGKIFIGMINITDMNLGWDSSISNLLMDTIDRSSIDFHLGVNPDKILLIESYGVLQLGRNILICIFLNDGSKVWGRKFPFLKGIVKFDHQVFLIEKQKFSFIDVRTGELQEVFCLPDSIIDSENIEMEFKVTKRKGDIFLLFRTEEGDRIIIFGMVNKILKKKIIEFDLVSRLDNFIIQGDKLFVSTLSGDLIVTNDLFENMELVQE